MSASEELRIIEELKKTVPPPRTKAQFAAREEAKSSTPNNTSSPPTSYFDLTVPTRRRLGERRRCSFDIPVEIADKFHTVAVAQGLQMRDVVERLMVVFIEQNSDFLPAARSSK